MMLCGKTDYTGKIEITAMMCIMETMKSFFSERRAAAGGG